MKDGKKKINKIRNNRNLGLEILRMLLCFWITVIHSCKINTSFFYKLYHSKFHVPAFMNISFYFFYYNLYTRNLNKIKLRFERLLIPYIIIPIFIMIINNILFKLKINFRFNREFSINDLLIQFIFGIKIHSIFWFHFYLIFLTLFYSILSIIFKKDFLILSQILGVICYIIQYFGLVYIYFSKYKKINNYYMGTIIEMIPISVTGLTLRSLDLINKIKQQKYKSIFINIILIFILIKYNLLNNFRGFSYPGIKANLGGISLFIIFSIIFIF